MAMNEEALACVMVRSQFGAVAAETVRILLAAPGSSLPQVIAKAAPFCEKRSTESNSTSTTARYHALFRDSLAVLIQHSIAHAVERSCVVPETSTSEEPEKKKRKERASSALGKRKSRLTTQFSYYIRTEHALFRSRLPLYLGFARRRYGDVGEAAVRAFFERGRLTSHQLFSSILGPVLSDLDITVRDAETCLSDMAKSGLMRWSGRRDVGVVCKRFAGRDNLDDNEQDLMEQDLSGRSLESDDDGPIKANVSDLNGTEEPESLRVGRGHNSLVVGAPSKKNDMDVWSICFWHLNREFRNECCAIVVQGRVQNELAVRILRGGLRIALEDEDCEAPSDDLETSEVDVLTIQEQLKEDSAVGNHEFWEAMQLLIEQTPAFVIGIPEKSPTKLRFIPGRLVSDARQKTLEDLVLSRYGAVGRRVFRALAIDGGMEEKTLAEKCMLPLKVARENLFRMYQDRVVVMQEVPRSHDQQRASNWYYLWKVNTMSVYRNMTELMYKTILNLFIRLRCLEENGTTRQFDEPQLKVRKELLMGSIVRMDQCIMVMRDFGPVTAQYLPARYRIVDGPLGKIKKRR